MTDTDYTKLATAIGFLGAAISATEAAIDRIDDTDSFGFCDNLEKALSEIVKVQTNINRNLENESR